MFHSTIQVLWYMNCFILGFLLTALPRFTATRHATRAEITGFVLIFLGIGIFSAQFNWIAAESLFLALLVLLIRFVIVRIKTRAKTASSSGKAPQELVWVPFGIFQGILGTLLHILGQAGTLPKWAITVGKPMMDQGFLLSIVIGVGGFLIPRLMGTYEPSTADVSCDKPVTHHSSSNKTKLGLYAFLACALFLSFWFEGMGWFSLGYGLRAAVVTIAFFQSRALPRFGKVHELYVKMAYVSVWMTAAGFWGAAFFPDYHKEMLHITFIGGFSLMTFSVGTMVVLTHAGAMDVLRRPLWILWVVTAGLTFAFVERSLTAFNSEQYFKILGYAAGGWLAVAVLWFVFVLRYLIIIPEVDEFETMHQQAKNRMKSS
jgi:uncharacterized protein involved in response to NO